VRHLEAADLDALVSMPDAISAVRAALVDGASFEQPPRLVLDDGRLLVMAATHVPSRRSVVKVVTIREGRQPTIAGTVQWVDDGPGLTADAAHVTSLRTGAACGLATDLLAAPDASRRRPRRRTKGGRRDRRRPRRWPP
jgi:ornithine cyclodeaminase